MARPIEDPGAPVIRDLFEAPSGSTNEVPLNIHEPSTPTGPIDLAFTWRVDPVRAFEAMLRSARQATGRGYSENSIKVYLSMWRKFCRYLQGERSGSSWPQCFPISVYRVTTPDILSFLEDLAPKRAATRPDGRPATASASIRSRYVLILEMAFAQMKQLGLCEKNPATAVPAEKRFIASRDVRPPVDLSADEEAEIRRIAGETRRDEGNWRASRDYAMEQLILASGVRVSEIRILAMNDLEFGTLGKAAGDRAGEECLYLIIVPNGVRRPPRRIPVAPFAIEPLKAWLRLRILLAPAMSSQIKRDIVFPATEQGEPLAACTIYRHIATTLRRAEFRKRHVGPQVLRHTFATRQLRKAVSLPTVSAWLGHVHISSTQIYRGLSTAGEPGEVV